MSNSAVESEIKFNFNAPLRKEYTTTSVPIKIMRKLKVWRIRFDTKIDFYDIVNKFLPGLVFMGIIILFFFNETKDIIKKVTEIGSTGLEVLVTISCFAIAYEIGYIIFRIGATIIEPILKRLFGWSEFSLFVEAQKRDNKDRLFVLAKEYGYVRTQISLFIILAIISGFKKYWIIVFVLVLLIILFSFSACNYIKKTKSTIESLLNNNNNN